MDGPDWDGKERRHRALSDDDAEAIAEHMTAKLVARLADEQTAERVIGVWSRRLDQQIGRGVRRLALYVALALLAIAAVKFDVLKGLLR